MNAGEPLCAVLEWDSTFFGWTIARAMVPSLTPERGRAIEAWCAEHAVDCLYFLAAADDRATGRVLEDLGFHLVDIRVTLERTIGPELSDLAGLAEAAALVRPAAPADIAALKAIAGVSHRNTRFHADVRFDREQCDELYRVWIEKSCLGDAERVFVIDQDGSPAGYMTVHLEGSAGRLGLLGVDPARRRGGLARRLVLGALAWLRDQKAGRAYLLTQGVNVDSQRLFQGLGFRTSAVALWYHRWFS